MSTYRDTCDDSEVECPYCGYKYQPEPEGFDEDERPEECEECGKTYHLHQSFSVTHFARPDCEANDSNHDYQPVELRSGRTHGFCTACGDCEPVTSTNKEQG